MTDNEIIKALECLTGEMISCKDCPYSANYTHFDCQRQVAKDALDLINRQKAEILRLQNKIELLEMEKKSLKEDSDKSKATAMRVIKRQDAEIKRLKDSRDRWRQIAEAFDKATRENEKAGEE